MQEPQGKIHSPITNAAPLAVELFRAGKTPEEVVSQTKRAISTVNGYLCRYIKEDGITDPSRWVHEEHRQKIEKAIEALGIEDRLKPIFDYLNETVGYDAIRIVLAWRETNRNCLTEYGL